MSKEKRKLDAQSIPWISIAYVDEKFRYRLLDLETMNIIRSKDVVFQENQIFEDIENPTKFSDSSAIDIVLDPAPSQVIVDDEEIQDEITKEEEVVDGFEQGK